MPIESIDTTDALLTLAVIGTVNLLLRFLPDLLFSGKRKTPRFLLVLGEALPHAVMGMLIVYCLRNVSVVSYPYGLPELISCILTAALHFWRHNSLLSIGCGVASYMLLVQIVVPLLAPV